MAEYARSARLLGCTDRGSLLRLRRRCYTLPIMDLSTAERANPGAVAIRFQPLGKLYHFEAGGVADLRPGDFVLVSTTRGREMGEVASLVSRSKAGGGLKPIRIEGRNPQAALLAVLRSLRGTVARDSTRITGIEGEVFLRLPAPRSAPPGPTPPEQAGSGR